MGIRLMMMVLAVSLLAACVPAIGQDAPPAADDQQRLRREQAEQFRQMAQPIPPGAQAFTIMVGGDGAGPMRRIGGPLDPPLVPGEMHLVGGWLYVVRGFMLHQFRVGETLEALGAVDLRTEEEIAAEPPQPGMMVIGGPDPAAVPVSLTFSADGVRLFVLRGYMLRQYAAEGLKLLAEFDLRSEEERNRPRVEMRMGPGGPPPPPGPPAQ